VIIGSNDKDGIAGGSAEDIARFNGSSSRPPGFRGTAGVGSSRIGIQFSTEGSGSLRGGVLVLTPVERERLKEIFGGFLTGVHVCTYSALRSHL